MTRLLVSVRNAEEARRALAGGADVIDVKEPSRGALGAADPAVWREVVAAVAGRAPVSVALGELQEFSGCSAPLAASLKGVSWAKVGLANCDDDPNWRLTWRSALATFPPGVKRVAVAYADWRLAKAPRWEEVLDAAPAAEVSTVLIDTYDKSAGHLLDHLSLAALRTISSQAASRGLSLAIAGSLRMDTIAELSVARPNYIAVRGAACVAGREGTVDEQLVRCLSIAVRELAATTTARAAAKA